MTLLDLVRRNLLFHARGAAAVLLGVAVGTAVLSGALLVGDSLTGSLKDRALSRLAWVKQAVVAPRFFSTDLATRLAKSSGARVEAAAMLQVTVVTGPDTARRQVRGVSLVGVDATFFGDDVPAKFGDAFCGVNDTLARLLEIDKGGSLTLRIQKPSNLPRESALAKKDVAFTDVTLAVSEVFAGKHPAAAFSIRPGLDDPRNVFVPLKLLQDALAQPGQANALFIAGETATVQKALNETATLEDRGLALHSPTSRARDLVARYDRNRDGVLRGTEWLSGKKTRFASEVASWLKQADPKQVTAGEMREAFVSRHPYLALESKQLVLPPAVAKAAATAAKAADLVAAPTAVYLCRMEPEKGKRIAGVVAAVETDKKAPLGPFLPKGVAALNEGEIVLVDAGIPEPRPAVGSKITLRFKPPESHGPAADLRETFTLAGYIPMTGAAADPYLTPEFPGITDKDDAGDWSLPFDDPDWQQQTIRREYSDAYWDAYRATPRAYIALPEGIKLWASRFGALTSVRLAPTSTTLDDGERRFRAELAKELPPDKTGLVLEDAVAAASAAGQGNVPFGLLFLGFSFFLILSALLLVGLLTQLNLERRARELGVLFAEGFSVSVVRRMLLGEAAILSLAGVLLGTAAALAYSTLLVKLLAALWPGGVLSSFLTPHASLTSLLAGGVGTFVVSLVTIAWVVRSLSKVPPRVLLTGRTTSENDPGTVAGTWRGWTLIVVITPILGVALLLLGPRVSGHEAKAGTFFGSGACFLTAGLVGVYLWLKNTSGGSMFATGVTGIVRLAVRNAGRYPSRSLLTVGLLASAAFLLVAVESFRRKPPTGEGDLKGSDGGFSLVAETDLPLIRDISTDLGRQELLDRLRIRFQNAGLDPAEIDRRVNDAEALLKATTIVSLRAKAGDDASCLNLYKPRSPRVLGVPASMIDRGGFVFAGSDAKTSEERENPWRCLTRSDKDTPVIGEANTLMYNLNASVGSTINVPDDRGEDRPMKVVAALKDSVFQSSLLVSETDFLKLYPSQEGFGYLLVSPPTGKLSEVRKVLEAALADRGVEVTPTAEKIAAYQAVENTYLTTFQALGGLGLVLGSLGLAVVLLRSVWERRAELALLRAVGWSRGALSLLVLGENALLLALGLVVGTLAALLSIAPQLIDGSAGVPVANLLVLFAGVLVLGLTAAWLAVMGALRADIVPALRRE